MKKVICLFIIIGIALTIPCYAKENVDNIKADSWLYFIDTAIDNTMYKFGLKSADNIAEERLDEVKEAILLENTESLTKAKDELDEIMPNVENKSLITDISKTEEKIEQNYNLNLIDLTIKLNKYHKIEELIKGYDVVSISLIGLKKGYYMVYMANGRILSIQEKNDITTKYIEIDYTDVLKASQDQNYMNEKLDQLLKYKRIYEDAQSLIEKEGIKGGN